MIQYYTHTILNDLIRYFSLHGLFISAVMGVGQLFTEKKSFKNLIFFLLFLSFFFMETFTLLLLGGYIGRYPYFWALGAASLFMLGPSLYFLVSYTIQGKPETGVPVLFHYIPALIGGLLIITDTVLWHTSFQVQNMPIKGIILIVYTVAYFQLSIYMVYVPWYIFHSVQHASLKAVIKKPAGIISLILYCAFCTGMIMDIAYYLTTSYYVLVFSSTIIPSVVTFLFLLLFRYPDLYTAAVEAGVYRKQKRSYLEGIDIKTLIDSMQKIILEDKLYLSEDISLPELASRLDLSVHQLSELLNRNVNTSFSAYINSFRVNEACRLLDTAQDKTVLEICYEVGFSSKSSFNKAFKEITGITPREYRKK